MSLKTIPNMLTKNGMMMTIIKGVLGAGFIVGIFLVALWVFGASWIFILNVIFAFVSSLLVILAVFWTQKNKIEKLINNASKEELEALESFYLSKEEKEEEFWQRPLEASLEQLNQKEDLKSQNHLENPAQEKDSKETLPKRKFWQNFNAQNTKLGFKIFFVPLRLLAYVFLVFGFFILLKREWLDIAGFFSGIALANVFAILLALLWGKIFSFSYPQKV